MVLSLLGGQVVCVCPQSARYAADYIEAHKPKTKEEWFDTARHLMAAAAQNSEFVSSDYQIWEMTDKTVLRIQ